MAGPEGRRPLMSGSRARGGGACRLGGEGVDRSPSEPEGVGPAREARVPARAWSEGCHRTHRV